MLITDEASGFLKVYAANTTQSSYPSRVPTATKPTGDGVVNISDGFAHGSPRNLCLVLYGTGADNSTMSVRVSGWKFVTDLWIPFNLVEIAGTLSAAVGVSGKTITNSERFADTLVLTIANTNTDAAAISPANDTIGSVLVDCKGSYLLTVDPIKGTATDCNILWGVL